MVVFSNADGENKLLSVGVVGLVCCCCCCFSVVFVGVVTILSKSDLLKYFFPYRKINTIIKTVTTV
jgi:hypothetical protein